MNRTRKSTLKDTIKQDDEEERMLVSEEVEKLVRGELEKLEMECKRKKSGKGQTLKVEEKPEGKAERDHVTFQDEEGFRFNQGSDWAEEAKKDWDTLTLQDEPGSISDYEEEPERSFLAWQIKGEATTGKEKPKGEEGLSPVKEKEDGVEASEEVGQEKEAPKLRLRVPSTESTNLWSQYRDKIKQAVHNQKLSFSRFNFTRVFSQETPEAKTKSREEFPAFQARSWDHEPMLSRLFSMVPGEGQTKKFALRWPPASPRKGSKRLSTIPQDKKPSEHDLDSEMEEVCSRSPDSLLAKSHEIMTGQYFEPEMEETEADWSPSRLLQSESLFSYPGDDTVGTDHTSSVWSMGQRISHWRMTHNQVVQAEKNDQEKAYKQRLLKHERDTKAAVPLPLQEKIEEEILIILMDTFRDYQLKIGANHPLTIEMEDKIDELHLLLQARGAI